MKPYYYTLNEFAELIGRKPNTIYNRLTERPQKVTVRFAQWDGARWNFPKRKVDTALAHGEPLIKPLALAEVLDSRSLSQKDRFQSQVSSR